MASAESWMLDFLSQEYRVLAITTAPKLSSFEIFGSFVNLKTLAACCNGRQTNGRAS